MGVSDQLTRRSFLSSAIDIRLQTPWPSEQSSVLSNVDADGSYIFLGEMNKGVDVINDSGC
jgi:hypothetical protein